MSPADLKDFTPGGRDQLAKILRSRATPATVKPATVASINERYAAEKRAQPELELEPWVAPAPVIAPVALALSFVLPWPPSVNNLIRARAMQINGKWMAQVYKTAEHRKYLEAVHAIVGEPVPTEALLVVSLKLFRPRRIGDIDGPIKALFDSLNGRVWADDSQIVDLRVTRHDDKHAPRVEVSIHAAPTQE